MWLLQGLESPDRLPFLCDPQSRVESISYALSNILHGDTVTLGLFDRTVFLTILSLCFSFPLVASVLSHLFRVLKGVGVLHMIHNRIRLTTGRGAMQENDCKL